MRESLQVLNVDEMSDRSGSGDELSSVDQSMSLQLSQSRKVIWGLRYIF